MRLEVVVETVEDALSAERGGANQIEVKCDYLEYGLTPSLGMVEQIRSKVSCDMLCMVRPHARSLDYSQDDLAAMQTDIRNLRQFGVKGFMLGALTVDGLIDRQALALFSKAAGDKELHFHLAWEQTLNPHAALETLIEYGVKGVRTSGGAGISGNVRDNIAQLKAYHEQAAGRIDLYLAGGITIDNVTDMVRDTGITNIHSGSGVRQPQTRTGAVSEDKVKQLCAALLQTEKAV